jgi:hypothetical protein
MNWDQLGQLGKHKLIVKQNQVLLLKSQLFNFSFLSKEQLFLNFASLKKYKFCFFKKINIFEFCFFKKKEEGN